MKKSAFTLIELLVVISIIAILASIAVPVFGKAMEKGKATNCAANLRQLGMGTVAYLNDNEDQMYSRGAESGGGAVAWPSTLHRKYVTNWKVFRSPFDKRPDRDEENAPVSYGLNTYLFDVHSSKITSPSQLILMASAVSSGKALDFPEANRGSTNVEVRPGSGPKSGTHNNRSQINVVYADAHAASINCQEFSSTADAEGARRWFPSGTPPE